jgi:hypothetical protein
MNSSENIAKSSELKREANTAGVAFLRTELDSSLTFAQLALQAGDEEKKSRNRANARKGYDTFMHLRERFSLGDLSAAERQEMEQKLTKLEAALRRLGETL